MRSLFKAVLLLGVLSLVSACGSVYKGAVTDLAASEQRVITDDNGNPLTVRVDVWGRDTIQIDDRLDRERSRGIRYFSQITFTSADGTVRRSTVPDGRLTSGPNGVDFRSGRNDSRVPGASGYDTPQAAMNAAWEAVNGVNNGVDVRSPLRGTSNPGPSIDGMFGAIDTATN